MSSVRASAATTRGSVNATGRSREWGCSAVANVRPYGQYGQVPRQIRHAPNPDRDAATATFGARLAEGASTRTGAD